MTVVEVASPSAGEATYIRGGRGQGTSERNVVRVTAWSCVIAVAAAAIALGVGALRHNAQVTQLRDHGVRVTATITACAALASGTGVTADGFRCTAAYVVAGHHHTGLLRNTYDFYPVGTSVAAVVDPERPGLVSSTTIVTSSSAGWKPLIVPLVLLALSAVGTAALLRRGRETLQTAGPQP
jgi:hypothetical protein